MNKQEKRIAEMQSKLNKAEDDLNFLTEAGKRLKSIEKNLKELSDYHQADWIKDHETFQGENYYSVLGEDTIWNLMQEIYAEKIRFLKTITKNL